MTAQDKPYFTIDGVDISTAGGTVIYRKYRDGREECFPVDEAQDHPIILNCEIVSPDERTSS